MTVSGEVPASCSCTAKWGNTSGLKDSELIVSWACRATISPFDRYNFRSQMSVTIKCLVLWLSMVHRSLRSVAQQKADDKHHSPAIEVRLCPQFLISGEMTIQYTISIPLTPICHQNNIAISVLNVRIRNNSRKLPIPATNSALLIAHDYDLETILLEGFDARALRRRLSNAEGITLIDLPQSCN
jgi:hypothetical protein